VTVISVIVGSTREGRFSEKPAKWILQHLKKREGVDARLLDLRDFPMPFFDQPAPPAMPGRPPYKNEVVQRWTAAIAQSHGFVFVTPEYNYGPSAVLKNAIDWVYPEWHRKAVGFVSYGSAMGARSVQQLRETAIEPSSVLSRQKKILDDHASPLTPQEPSKRLTRGVRGWVATHPWSKRDSNLRSPTRYTTLSRLPLSALRHFSFRRRDRLISREGTGGSNPLPSAEESCPGGER
jgi:NAD(P)H-dependent FMN reductase